MWRVLAYFMFVLGFCQIDSMFGQPLGLLIFLFATAFPFSSISTFLDCTVDDRNRPPDTFSPAAFLVNLHTFSAAFRKLDFRFPQITSLPSPLALLGAVSVLKTYQDKGFRCDRNSNYKGDWPVLPGGDGVVDKRPKIGCSQARTHITCSSGQATKKKNM